MLSLSFGLFMNRSVASRHSDPLEGPPSTSRALRPLLFLQISTNNDYSNPLHFLKGTNLSYFIDLSIYSFQSFLMFFILYFILSVPTVTNRSVFPETVLYFNSLSPRFFLRYKGRQIFCIFFFFGVPYLSSI